MPAQVGRSWITRYARSHWATGRHPASSIELPAGRASPIQVPRAAGHPGPGGLGQATGISNSFAIRILASRSQPVQDARVTPRVEPELASWVGMPAAEPGVPWNHGCTGPGLAPGCGSGFSLPPSSGRHPRRSASSAKAAMEHLPTGTCCRGPAGPPAIAGSRWHRAIPGIRRRCGSPGRSKSICPFSCLNFPL